MTELTAIVTHEVEPGSMEAAADRIRGNGVRMAAMAGFIDRVLLKGDGNRLVTITRWTSWADYEAWVAHNRETNPNKGVAAPFSSPGPELCVPYEGSD